MSDDFAEKYEGKVNDFISFLCPARKIFLAILHGYGTQILEYAKAEATDKMIYVIVDLGHPGKIERLQQLHDRKYDEGKILLVDCHR